MKYTILYKILSSLIILRLLWYLMTHWYLINGLLILLLSLLSVYLGTLIEQKGVMKRLYNFKSMLLSNIKVKYK